MTLHEDEVVDAPGLVDLEAAGDGVFEIGDLAAVRFLEASECEMRLERTIFRRLAEVARSG